MAGARAWGFGVLRFFEGFRIFGDFRGYLAGEFDAASRL
jgi:hypothetical protein